MRDGQSLQHGGQGLLLEHHQRHLPARRLQTDADVNQSPPNAGMPSTSRARRDMVDKPKEKQKKPLAANQSSQGRAARGLVLENGHNYPLG